MSSRLAPEAFTMPPRRSIRNEDWERLRPTIRKLYLEEDRSLKDVLLILGTFHSFYPSKAQLEWKLKQWRLTKNMGIMDWKYIGNEIHRRKCRGKESKVYLSGIPLRMKAVERGVSRYCYETAIEKATRHVPTPPMPEDQPLLVCTPAPEEVNWPCRLDNIPWLLSRRLIEDLAIKVPSHLRISSQASHSSSQGLVDIILFPQLHLQSYTVLLGQTYQTLRSIMPEEYDGAHTIRAQSLLQKGIFNTINAEVLVVLVFLLSNNLILCEEDFEQQERHAATTHLLLHLFRESGSNMLAKGQYSRLPLSLQSSLDGLFREAVKASDLEAVELLLQAGFDSNTSFSSPVGFYPWCTNALQYAASSNHPGLLQILIGHGAATQKIDIKTIAMAWLKRNIAKGSPEATMNILLSIYLFRSEDETQAVELLFRMSYTPATPITEAVIKYFRSNFSESSSVAKSQLLITAIRSNSRFVNDLVAELGHYVNSCGYYPETPMTAATYVGNLQLCKQLLQLGATFEPGHEAPTPLQWAASFSDVSIVQQLLDWGADVNFCHPRPTYMRVGFEDITSMRFSGYVAGLLPGYEEEQRELSGSLGRTALQAALLGGNTETASCLLTAGAELVGGELVMAIWNRQFDIIGGLLDRGASFQDECKIFGTDTILEAAILSDNTDLVHQIIATDKGSVTGQALCASVCLAKFTGDFTILRHLLTYNSELLASEDNWIGTAICLSVHLGCMEIPEIILSSGLYPGTSWPLHITRFRDIYNPLRDPGRFASSGSLSRNYLTWRRSLRIQSCGGRLDHRRPLMETAVSLRQLDFLKLLVEHGYQPGPSSSLGILCYRNLSIDILRDLLDLGIKMTERVITHVIDRNGDREVIDWLLSTGVDVNARSDHLEPLVHMIAGGWFGFTPLQAAVFRGNLDLVQYLVEFGSDINEPPYPGGLTSLQCAVNRGSFGIVHRLLELGADPNAPGAESFHGRTAIEIAAEYGRLDIIQLLLNSGVETSGYGRRQFVRSVAFAKREGHHAVMKLLKSHAGWTDADENLMGQKDLIPGYISGEIHMPPCVRRYYGVGSDEERSVEGAASRNKLFDEASSSAAKHASDYEEISQTLVEDQTFENTNLPETCLLSEDASGVTQDLSDELDEPSGTLLSTFYPTSNLPKGYEALLEEVGLEFLPSSMSYQIRAELEGDGCLEESEDDLWAEEYSRFVTELF